MASGTTPSMNDEVIHTRLDPMAHYAGHFTAIANDAFADVLANTRK